MPNTKSHEMVTLPVRIAVIGNRFIWVITSHLLAIRCFVN